ncbi:MAG: type II secretion system protein GspD [Akkermansiaceae bacterium]|nr:type II secretion system protein GspD [Akkermansiaceae bacterium]
MKPPALLLLPIALFTAGLSSAQDAPPPLTSAPPAADPGPLATPPAPRDTPLVGDSSVPTIDGAPPRIVAPETEPLPAIEPVPVPPPSPPEMQGAPGAPPPAPGTAFGPLEQQKLEAQQTSDGYIIKDAPLNEIFQFLAKSAGKQYFHNVKITGQEYLVTGHLNDGDPQQQMEELAFMYGLSLHVKGNTIYALTQAQLSQLPAAEYHYQLKYLRPSDIDQIKELIRPVLSPGTGIVNFEPKTNTVIIIDSAHRIEQARQFLRTIDQAKGQVVVETKIFRVNSRVGEKTGIDWSSSLGPNGTPLAVTRDLNSIFGLDPVTSSSGNLVLSPIQLSGVLRALADGNLARQVSNPTLITEDNEMASIFIIDRIPILTTTTTQATTGGNPTVTEEVRYKIGEEDPSISDDPEKHREIGISLVVTPTVLNDGTIRMRMRPRSAQISEYVRSTVTGNDYPKVTEAMIESIARVPDGHSLVVGGFYGEIQNKGRNKVPILGDIPVINFFFKSKDTSKEQSSLVFVITPKAYDPSNLAQNNSVSRTIRGNTLLERDHDWADPYNPGPAHEPNLRRAVRSLQPAEAPYYPRAEELAPPKPKTRRTTPPGRP